MKTQEELNTIKEEMKTLNTKLAELTEEELVQVSGGSAHIGIRTGGASGLSDVIGLPGLGHVIDDQDVENFE